jgi:peroxiredoxin
MWRNVLAALACLVLAACAPGTGPAAGERVSFGGAGDFVLRDLDGNEVRLSDHVGRDVVVIDFWATFCLPCKAAHPFLQRLQDKYGPQGLVVLAVSLDGPETRAEVAPYVRKNGYTFKVLLDDDTRLTQVLNPRNSLPLTVIVGRDGKTAQRWEGFSLADEERIEGIVKSLVEGGR